MTVGSYLIKAVNFVSMEYEGIKVKWGNCEGEGNWKEKIKRHEQKWTGKGKMKKGNIKIRNKQL